MDAAMALEVTALSHQKAVKDATARGDSEIQRFYNNCVIFLTGGSGFIGKQLIEKLLRSCHISKVYMLLRPKKGKNVQERLDDLLRDSAFEILRKQQPNFTAKILAVEGDVAELRLGINDEDWKTLTEEVNVIFHVAATTRFDETLRSATLINVRGARETLMLGRACNKLRSYVHVSTAYSHATTTSIGNEIHETFSDAPVPPETLISMAETMDPERLISITPEFIKNWPNTYTFTKSVSEELVRTMSSGLPICIVRPGIVICSYREPLPGWLDLSCISGASGLVAGIALGVLHTIYVGQDVNLGLVPCDYVNNAIIVAGRDITTRQEKGGNDTRIYTVTSKLRNSVTWRKLENVIINEMTKFPTPSAFNYAWLTSTSNKLLFQTLALLFHFIPALIADLVCLLMGRQRRYKKAGIMVNNVCNVLSYFMRNDWNFVDDNLSKLYSGLSKHDKIIFNFDITDINWDEYIVIWTLGIRKYLIKDGLKNTAYAIRKQWFFQIVNYFIMTLYLYCMWKLIYLLFYIARVLF